jgi:predicted CoA-substrate-specific enzyme activase
MLDGVIEKLLVERTLSGQREYFHGKIQELQNKYPACRIVSCGYGKQNIESTKNVSELTALSIGLHNQLPNASVALDIGGQDTKLIRQEDGKLKEFFMNDKCAAGSGLFLSNVLNILDKRFEDIDVTLKKTDKIKLSSVCAVFAQSEIIELLANGATPEEIINATLRQIFIQAFSMIRKCKHTDEIVLSGGLASIKGIKELASDTSKKRILVPEYPQHLSAIGCAIIAAS